MGEKVAIVSDKPQTTRRDIRAIWTTDDAQVVFTDTPGFHKPRTLMGARLNDLVGDAVAGVDVMSWWSTGAGRRARRCVRLREAGGGRARRHERICVVNKIDRLAHHAVVPQLAAAQALGEWDEIVPRLGAVR